MIFVVFCTFSSHMEHVTWESIVITRIKKVFTPFDECPYFVYILRTRNKQK